MKLKQTNKQTNKVFKIIEMDLHKWHLRFFLEWQFKGWSLFLV